MVTNLPPEVAAVTDSFLERLKRVLGENLEAVYLYGALTFPDSRDHVKDIDFHVIVRRPLDDGKREAVQALCLAIARDFPALGAELDGYFITLQDTRQTAPPPTQMWPLRRTPVDDAWALHCAHILAGRHVVLYGPDPRELYLTPSWADLQAALFGEIRFVDRHLEDAPAHCVLNTCRLMYSFETHDVVISKLSSANWALQTIPGEWHGLIEAALRAYQKGYSSEDHAFLTRQVGSFVAFAWCRIASSRARG